MHSKINLGFTSLATVILALSVSCDNPVDDVQKADTSDPSQPAAGAATGGAKLSIQADSSKLEFVGSKVTGSHRGGFKKFSGTVTLAKDGASVVGATVVIDMDSTYSDSDKLTGHLKNADFFDVDNFPTSRFEVTSVTGGANSPEYPDATHTIAGHLTLHGVTKGIQFAGKLEVAADGVRLKSEFAINRKDFGIVYAGRADDLIRDEVVLEVDIRAGK